MAEHTSPALPEVNKYHPQMKGIEVQTLSAVAYTDDASIVGLSPLNWVIV